MYEYLTPPRSWFRHSEGVSFSTRSITILTNSSTSTFSALSRLIFEIPTLVPFSAFQCLGIFCPHPPLPPLVFPLPPPLPRCENSGGGSSVALWILRRCRRRLGEANIRCISGDSSSGEKISTSFSFLSSFPLLLNSSLEPPPPTGVSLARVSCSGFSCSALWSL